MKHQTLFFLQKIKKKKNKSVLCCKFACLFNLPALRKAKTLWSFGLSECNRVKVYEYTATVILHFIRGTTMVISSCFPGGLSLSNSLLFPFKNNPQLRRNA